MPSIQEKEDYLWAQMTHEERSLLNTEIEVWMGNYPVISRTLHAFCEYYRFKVNRVQISPEVEAWMKFCLQEPSI